MIDQRTQAGILVVVQADLGELARETAEDRIQLVGIQDRLDSRHIRGLLFRELVAFPDRDQFRAFPHEEDLAHRRIWMGGRQDQHGLFLVGPGQVEQVAVLNEVHRTISTPPRNLG